MAHFVYPAIFYYDEEYNNFAVAFPDVSIYTDGDTIEEAYKNAQEYLLSYLDCCDQLGQNPDAPSDYNSVVASIKSENETVMLVSVDFVTKTRKKTNDNLEQKQTDIIEDFESILKSDSDDFSLPSIE